MIIRFLVLLAAIAQVVAAYTIGAGSFETSGAAPAQPTLIQPAGWAFTIWGLIYLLALFFAVYQAIPKYDNQVLRKIRIPAFIAFSGSIAWLYFAASLSWTIWLTIPTLVLMALALSYVVAQTPLPQPRAQFFSQTTLLPYAAWTGIAQWLNVQALLNQQNIIDSGATNVASNVFFLICIAAFSLYWLRRARYSVWYGGVIMWATIGIIAANTSTPEGSYIIVTMAGALLLATMALIRGYAPQHNI